MIHHDRFAAGDIVTWRGEDWATRTGGRKKYGDRITIKEVRDTFASDIGSVGHTQHVTIVGDPDAGFGFDESCFSGAYFRHLAAWEK